MHDVKHLPGTPLKGRSSSRDRYIHWKETLIVCSRPARRAGPTEVLLSAPVVYYECFFRKNLNLLGRRKLEPASPLARIFS